MTAYHLIVLTKDELTGISITCPLCQSKLTINGKEPKTNLATIAGCGACGREFDDETKGVIGCFLKLHEALKHTKTHFEFPIQKAIESP